MFFSDVLQRWFPSNNNNLVFLLRDVCGDGARRKCSWENWFHLGPPPPPGIHRPPADAEKVLIYTDGRGGWAVILGDRGKRPRLKWEGPSWHVTSTFQHPNVSEHGQERLWASVSFVGGKEPALLALGCGSLISVSLIDCDWWEVLDGGFINSTVSVCVVLYRCVCLFCLLRLLPPADRWREAGGRAFHFKLPVGLAIPWWFCSKSWWDGLQRLFSLFSQFSVLIKQS